MCDCGNNCDIPNGPIGPQGPKGDQGDTGTTGATGATGLNADELPIVWVDLPLENDWVAGVNDPQYRISGGYLYFRGVAQRPTPTVAPFTNEDFGFTKAVQTIVGDDRSLPSKGDFTIERLTFGIGAAGVAPLFNEVHTLLLDSIPPLNIQ